MPIVAEDMAAKGLIENGVDGGFRAASYDLHVGAILEAPQEDKRSSGSATEDIRVSTGFSLRPQGMVRVISRERVKLPENIIGYALTKNGLSNKGILAINIGIIDPGYEGPISSTTLVQIRFWLRQFGQHAGGVAAERPWCRAPKAP